MNDQIVKANLKNRSITIDLLSMISDMDLTKDQKESLALDSMKLTREDARVVWKDDRIECIRLNKALEKIEITIVIDKNGEMEINGEKV